MPKYFVLFSVKKYHMSWSEQVFIKVNLYFTSQFYKVELDLILNSKKISEFLHDLLGRPLSDHPPFIFTDQTHSV
jgi:hypothetical protein